jgi:hypothetical protein
MEQRNEEMKLQECYEWTLIGQGGWHSGIITADVDVAQAEARAIRGGAAKAQAPSKAKGPTYIRCKNTAKIENEAKFHGWDR